MIDDELFRSAPVVTMADFAEVTKVICALNERGISATGAYLH